MKTETLLVGGGLSGLHTAHELHRRGEDFLLVEARERLGGRILSKAGSDSGSAFDLGPTWFWPGQRRMESLVRSLGLEAAVFEQPSRGDALFENEGSEVMRGLGGASMAGSWRLDGGLSRLIEKLAASLPGQAIRSGSRVTRIERGGDRVLTTVLGADGEETFESARIVIALPPRLAAFSITFSPALSDARRETMQRVATWMAGSAKVITLYEEPFWRAAGLSGDAISYRGPLGEIHDASPLAGGPAALFGFVGVAPDARTGQEDALRRAAVAQLGNLFGEPATRPLEVLVKDWAFDPLTATPDDRVAQIAHPIAGPSEAIQPTWGGRLLWSGSETATGGQRNNGYLEGALEASERILRELEAMPAD